MTIKNRLSKLEAQRPQVIEPQPGPYTDEQQAQSMAALAEALGQMLGIDPGEVAAELPGVLAGIGGEK